jgi:hypothetical protein
MNVAAPPVILSDNAQGDAWPAATGFRMAQTAGDASIWRLIIALDPPIPYNF